MHVTEVSNDFEKVSKFMARIKNISNNIHNILQRNVSLQNLSPFANPNSLFKA